MDIPQSTQSTQSTDTAPIDWVPGPLPPRADIVRTILAIDPSADASDPAWVRVDGPGFSVEVNIGDEMPLTQFALHVRGGDQAVGFIATLLETLQLRAFDPGSGTGIFDPATAIESMKRWRQYRDQVLAERSAPMD